MPDPTVVANQLSYRVEGAVLVSNVDLAVSAGELVAVIGPNGAGKSTLLGLLSGTLKPSEGDVVLNGVNTAQSLPGGLALQRSLLTQRQSMDIPYSAAQVVEMGRFPHRHDETNNRHRDAAAVVDAMNKTDTTQFADRIYATLSKGEQTLVSLARVIAQATPIVLLDEPTTALDVAHQARIMGRTVELAREQKTTIVVLHDLNAAAVYADRIVVMHRGEVVADGNARQVLKTELLSRVYDHPMVVVDHPFRDCPLVLAADLG